MSECPSRVTKAHTVAETCGAREATCISNTLLPVILTFGCVWCTRFCHSQKHTQYTHTYTHTHTLQTLYPPSLHSAVDFNPHGTYDDVIALPYLMYGAKTAVFVLFLASSLRLQGRLKNKKRWFSSTPTCPLLLEGGAVEH